MLPAATANADQFLSTPSGWRATEGVAGCDSQRRPISIHALRVEGDQAQTAATNAGQSYFYPRPPGGGRPDDEKFVHEI